MKITIIIPVYNEINTISLLLKKVISLKIQKQIIIVDDFSNDGSRELVLKKFHNKVDKIILHKRNSGKGSAIKSAQKFINGDFVIIQDADLEYDPEDYHLFIKEIKEKKIKALYGSRVLKKDKFSNVQNFSHKIRIWGNLFLTFISNKINKQSLTDAHTCLKMIDANIFKSINLMEKGFAFCPEITTKLSKINVKIYEIPISYHGRTYKEGKKITAMDGIEAILALIKYRYFS